MATITTGPIDNYTVNGVRAIQRVSLRISNSNPNDAASVLLQGYYLDGGKNLYVLDAPSIAPNTALARVYYADFDGFEFEFTISGAASGQTRVSIWGLNAGGGQVPLSPVVLGLTGTDLGNFFNPQVVSPSFSDAAKQGLAYRASTSYQLIAISGFLVMQITNPTGSNKNIYLDNITNTAEWSMTTSLIANADLTVPVTSINPVNQSLSSPNASIAQIGYALNATDPIVGGQLFNTEVIGYGYMISPMNFKGSFVITPGNTLLIRLQNLSSDVLGSAVNLAWSEF